MRSDMFKVIVERPRRSGGQSKGRAKARAFDGPVVEGIARPHRERKSLNENLAPLRRFIAARVGRHWDKVYAEIAANLRPSSTVQQHVRDHLGDIIAVNTLLRDGEVLVHHARRWGGPAPLKDSAYRFYVHPVARTIQRNRDCTRGQWRRAGKAHREAEAAATAARRIDLGPLRQLHKLAGCWFEVVLEPVDPAGAGPPAPRDAIRDAGLSALAPQRLYGLRDVRAASKRQLGRRELATYGLANDAEAD